MATSYTSSATTVTTLSDYYKKVNTTVKTGIKLITEETKWFQDYPVERIDTSGNENRVPLELVQPTNVAMLVDGGNEAVMSTPAPTHGTFVMCQMNKRYGFTGLATAFDQRSRQSMIENQIQQQAAMAIYAFGRAIGLQTYGSTTGTVAVVKTTGSGSATQTIALKNAYGSASLCPGGDSGVQDTYLSNLFRVGEHICLNRAGSVVEFAAVTASPGTNGAGSIDATFTSSITPTVGDLILFANQESGTTLADGSDLNNWPWGFTDVLTSSSVLGVTTSSYAAWQAGSQVSSSQRLSFSVKEKMINDCWNAGGVKINRFIMAQGVRRDAITGQGGARRYDSSEYDLEGDLQAGDGEKYFTSQLAFPNAMIGWYNMAYTKVELSDMPNDGMSKSIFKLDKVQGKSQIAASYDYYYNRIPTSRAATGYASNLTSS